MKMIQGAWCQWAMQKWSGCERAERAPTWQDLDSWIYGGYGGVKCPVGGRYLLSDDLSSDHDDRVTCTVHGNLLRAYGSDGVRLGTGGR